MVIGLHTYRGSSHTQGVWFMFLKDLRLVLIEELITKKGEYHLFDVVVEFHKFVFYYTF
jgi:hypothetical protein